MSNKNNPPYFLSMKQHSALQLSHIVDYKPCHCGGQKHSDHWSLLNDLELSRYQSQIITDQSSTVFHHLYLEVSNCVNLLCPQVILQYTVPKTGGYWNFSTFQSLLLTDIDSFILISGPSFHLAFSLHIHIMSRYPKHLYTVHILPSLVSGARSQFSQQPASLY